MWTGSTWHNSRTCKLHADLPKCSLRLCLLFMKHLISLTELHLAVPFRREKERVNIKESNTESFFTPFFLTKSKHGKADSQAKHHRAPHHDWKHCHVWKSKEREKFTILLSQLDKRQGINCVEVKKKGITRFHTCHLCIFVVVFGKEIFLTKPGCTSLIFLL